MSSPSTAAIFCFSSISRTVAIRSRRLAASSNRISARFQFLRQIAMPALEEQTHIVYRRLVGFLRGEPRNTGPEAAVDMVLQAGMRVAAVEVDLAGGHKKVTVDEVDQPVRQVAREERAVIGSAVL